MTVQQYQRTLNSLYQRHIQRLSTAEKLELIALMSRQLAREAQNVEPSVSIMTLHGLGKEIWQGIDAQTYVSELRQEWERAE
ncbi:MAG: hypothetical protein JXR84_20070 [Anaerolineae bacterium]|nr:hypothetical protein [Anaerolineae bacterium]